MGSKTRAEQAKGKKMSDFEYITAYRIVIVFGFLVLLDLLIRWKAYYSHQSRFLIIIAFFMGIVPILTGIIMIGSISGKMTP